MLLTWVGLTEASLKRRRDEATVVGSLQVSYRAIELRGLIPRMYVRKSTQAMTPPGFPISTCRGMHCDPPRFGAVFPTTVNYIEYSPGSLLARQHTDLFVFFHRQLATAKAKKASWRAPTTEATP